MNWIQSAARRLLCMFLCASMVFCMIPASVYAATSEDGLCQHHTQHTEDCGYAAPSDCGHIHDDSCGEAGADCSHTHDGVCGYAEGASCTYDCQMCTVEMMQETEPTSESEPTTEPEPTDETESATESEPTTTTETEPTTESEPAAATEPTAETEQASEPATEPTGEPEMIEVMSEEITMEMPVRETSALSIAMLSLDSDGLPMLKPTNEVRWIDRLADMPDYATDFYTWLETNATVSGALADPTLGTAVGKNYTCLVATITGTVTFSTAADADIATINSAVNTVVSRVAADKFKEGSVYMNAVYSAFDRDHPEIFWLSDSSVVGYSYTYRFPGVGGENKKATYTMYMYFYLTSVNRSFDVRAEEYRSVDAIASAIAARDAAVADILSGATGNTYEKIRYFNEWLTKNNCYNNSSSLSSIDHDCRECTSALIGTAGADGPVCEGYARAFKVLCDHAGIPCVLVDGTAYNGVSSGGHMWNYVQVDGNWYAVDVTWNDPTVYGVSDKVSNFENENYLLVGSDTIISGYPFIASHPVSNTVTSTGVAFINGPQLSAQAYTPPVDCEVCQWDEYGFCTVCGGYQPADGDDGSYTIQNAGQLYWFAQQVNLGNGDYNAVLSNSITVPGNAPEWTPIGVEINYEGTFDGDGFSINGLTGTAAFIGYLSGTVKLLVLDQASFDGAYVSGIVDTNSGTIQNCAVLGTLSGASCASGIVRVNSGTVENCYAAVTMAGTGTADPVVTINSGTVANCFYDSTLFPGAAESSLGTPKTTTQFAGGEVAYLLGSAWGQRIGTDAYPVLGGEPVYLITDCLGNTVASNSSESGRHAYIDGLCSVCKGTKDADVTGDISVESIILSAVDGINYYSLDGGISKSAYSGIFTITGETTANTLTVESGEHKIVLSSISASGGQPFAVLGGGSALVTLSGTNTLQGGAGYPGVLVEPEGNLSLGGKGCLNVTGGRYAAGIGGGTYAGCGTVTITGGTIIASGGDGGAGIGGGYDGAGGTVVITGGNIKADGTEDIGHGRETVKGSLSSGTLTNGTEEVSLTIITLEGVEDGTPVTALTGVQNYGLAGVVTIEDKLYIYLPSGIVPTAVVAGGKTYSGTISDGTGTFTNEIISVDINWGTLEFTYTDGIWDPETHTYGEGSWSDNGTGFITVSNSGNVDVSVNVHFATDRTDISGTVADGEDYMLVVSDEKQFLLTLSGKPGETLESTPIGTVTVTIFRIVTGSEDEEIDSKDHGHEGGRWPHGHHKKDRHD